jgi:hypothetical protein
MIWVLEVKAKLPRAAVALRSRAANGLLLRISVMDLSNPTVSTFEIITVWYGCPNCNQNICLSSLVINNGSPK